MRIRILGIIDFLFYFVSSVKTPKAIGLKKCICWKILIFYE
jgi:hypothetical protein